MKISILDQAVVSEGDGYKDALDNAVRLAQFGDDHGFHRFWLAEHHAMRAFASSAPEVTLGAIGYATGRIRIGSGATLLPYYKPYKVAELYHTLATLYPGRIDLGIGRAPGGPAEASEALSDNYLQNALNMENLAEELVTHIDGKGDGPPMMAPVGSEAPEIWMLGTSEKSAELAGQLQLNYNFGQFMGNADDTKTVIGKYRDEYDEHKAPYTMMTVTVFCADTGERARDIAMSTLVWGIIKEREFGESTNDDGLPSIESAKNFELSQEEHHKVEHRLESMITGDPETVGSRLKEIAARYPVDEIMISTNTYSIGDKLRSFELVKQAVEDWT